MLFHPAAQADGRQQQLLRNFWDWKRNHAAIRWLQHRLAFPACDCPPSQPPPTSSLREFSTNFSEHRRFGDSLELSWWGHQLQQHAVCVRASVADILQQHGQRNLNSASESNIILCTETFFAAICAFMLLGEVVSLREIAGGSLIATAAILASR